MPLPGLLRRLLAFRWRRRSQRLRYSEADDLEKRTQAHYREITRSDASGRPTQKR